MKVKIELALILAALAAGCAANKDKIVFSDEQEVRAAAANTASAPAKSQLERADELAIEQAVFGYLLERRFWDLADYSAVFLQADDPQVAELMKKYRDHVPPIKQSSRAEIRANQAPLDKDTDKPAMILSVDVNEPNANGSVDAVGRWYGGDAVTGFRSFHLTKLNDDWQITDVK
jgi:hypothetical protein